MTVEYQTDSQKPGLDALILTNKFKITNVSLPHYEKYEKYEKEEMWLHLDIIPIYNHEGLVQYMKENQVFNSKIRYMNGCEYKVVFGEANPQEITGKIIELSFAMPKKGVVDFNHCSQSRINRFERKEIYSPEFKVSGKPLTIVSIMPDCHAAHVAPIAWGKAHYYLTMLFNGDKFDKIRDLFNAQKREWPNYNDFPKKRLPVELRQFCISSEY